MKRTLLISAGVVVVLLLVAVLVLPRLVDVDRHRPQIEKALADATGRDVKLGKVDLAIFPSPALHAAGLTIGDDPRFGTQPFLESGNISVKVSLFPLLRGKLEIGMLTIDAPKVRIVRGRSGWNLASLVNAPAEGAAGESATPPAAGSASGGRPPSGGGAESSAASAISIREIHLDGGRVQLVDESIPNGGEKPLVAKDIDLVMTDVSTTSPIGVDLSFGIEGSGRAHLEGKIGPLAGPGTGGGWPLNADLRIDGFKGGPAAPYLESLTGLRVRGGDLDLDLHLDGEVPRQMGFRGDATLKDLDVDPLVGGGRPVRMNASLSLEGSMRDDTTELTRGDLTLGGTKVSITGSLSGIHGDPVLDASIKTDKVPVIELLPVLAMVGPLVPSGLGSDGSLSLEASAKGPLNRPDEWRITGRAVLSELSLSDPSLREPIRGISGTALLQGDRASVTLVGASLGKSRLQGSCNIEDFARPKIKLSLSAPVLDVDELLGMIVPAEGTPAAPRGGAATRAPSGGATGAAPSSPASPAASAAGTALARVTLHGDLEAAEVSLLGLKMKDMRAAVDLTNGRAHVGDLAVSLYGGSITGDASADLAAAGPPFQIKANLKGVDFDSMAKDFSPDMAGLLFGTLDAGLDLSGTGTTRQDLRRAMEGNATFSLENGKITSVGLLKNLAKVLEAAGGKGVGEEETPFSFLGGSFDIRGGKARTKDLRLESTDLTMKGEGKLDMDLGMDLDLDSRLSPEASAVMVAQRENLRFLEDSKDRIRLDLHMGGTLIKPVVTVDPETIRRVLRNAAKERLKKRGLRDLFKRKNGGR